MTKKYELLQNVTKQHHGITLYTIKALRDFGDVKAGDIGGWVESEDNLSQYGKCWIYDDAIVYGKSRVCNNATIHHEAEVHGSAKVSENASVYDKAIVGHNAHVYGNANVYREASVLGYSKVYGNAELLGNSMIVGNARVYGNAVVTGSARIFDKAHVYGNAVISDEAVILDNARVYRKARISGCAKVFDDAKVRGKAKVNGYTMISGDAIVESLYDYIVIKNNWSSGRYFTYTRSNKLFRVGCFLGTGEELIAKAYKDSKRSGDCYKASVHYVQALVQAFQNNSR